MKNFNVTSMLVMLMFMCITSMQAQSITPSKKIILIYHFIVACGHYQWMVRRKNGEK